MMHPFLSFVVCICLIILSGLFSGLTLGLLSLDTMSLKIIAESGDVLEKEHAQIILPIRKKGNQLLCTLLLGNVIVNSTLSILMADFTSGWVGLVVSTALIVTFGEIFPQALCTRYGLLVGAKTINITRFFIVVLYAVAWPMSKLLDWILGQEVGTIYSRSELLKLISIHVEDPNANRESGLTHEDHKLLAGALEYSSKTVRDVMTNLDRVYMIEAGTRLNFDNMLEIYKSGYTRIPVYEGSRQKVIGILYVKDLILVDPDDEIEVRTVVTFHGRSGVRYVLDSTPLSEVFRLFKQSVYHMMIAVQLRYGDGDQPTTGPGADPFANQNTMLQAERTVTGVITLEDVLEEVIKDEIMDETDVAEAEARGRRGANANRADISQYMSVFSHKAREQSKLSPQEVDACAAYLSVTVGEFKPFQRHEPVLKGLIRNAQVVDIDSERTTEGMGASLSVAETGTPDDASHEDDAASEEGGGAGKQGPVLYRRGERSDFFTLILQGHVSVKAGSEEFQSELGPWSIMGNRALDVASIYIPDFTASVASGPARLLRIRKEEFFAAAKAAQMDAALAKRAIKRVSEAINRTAATRNLQGPALVAAIADQSMRDLVAGGSGGGGQGVHSSQENWSTASEAASSVGPGGPGGHAAMQDYIGSIHGPLPQGFSYRQADGSLHTWRPPHNSPLTAATLQQAQATLNAQATMHQAQVYAQAQAATVQAAATAAAHQLQTHNQSSGDLAINVNMDEGGGLGSQSLAAASTNRTGTPSLDPAASRQDRERGFMPPMEGPNMLPFQLPAMGGGYIAIPASALSSSNRVLLASMGTQEDEETRLLAVASQVAASQGGQLAGNAMLDVGKGRMVPMQGWSDGQSMQVLQEKAQASATSPVFSYTSWAQAAQGGAPPGIGPPHLAATLSGGMNGGAGSSQNLRTQATLISGDGNGNGNGNGADSVPGGSSPRSGAVGGPGASSSSSGPQHYYPTVLSHGHGGGASHSAHYPPPRPERSEPPPFSIATHLPHLDQEAAPPAELERRPLLTTEMSHLQR